MAISCKVCNKEITDSHDVNVLAFFGVKPTTFCNSCYASRERGITRHLFYFPKQPINGKLFTVGLILFSIFAVVLILALLVGFGQSEAGIGGRIAFLLFLFVILGWEWTLWSIARSKVKQAGSS